ncbi:Thyroid hormone receptor-associated protein 3 [Manacus vitellinus]|uniref:Thyroid hormone receptor-associated protein 3 n=1 Tax=Manacus vitellinus TaxID=328815 RepID=A0A093Q6P4_9PASS|nr:Thyroid hormone receptor-associated protein 3 [Manacus vitellinus]
MSKTNKSKSGSRSSRSRSGSRSRSRSFSKSRSRSRSISRSRKRRLSSRSRSRSYSPSHNRERNHPRVYQNRDFRGHNRGYRRPYYFRGRNRGFYPWGQYNRGGYGNYRSNWQNYRQAYSPRRGRSRSRSPKRSPTRKSPVCKSPTPVSSLYGAAPKEEGTAPGGGAFSKRQVMYLEEQKAENGKDKDQKVTNVEKEKSKEKGNFSELGSADGKAKSDSYGSKADSEKGYRGSQSPKRYKFRDDFDKMKVPEFHKEGHYGKEETDEQDKKDKGKGRKDSEFDDEPKFMSKVVTTSSKNQEEDRSGKWEGVVFLPPGKEKQRKSDEMEEESYSERSKKEERPGSKRAEPGHRGFVPEKNFRVTTYKSSQEKSSSPPPRKPSEVKEKPGTKVEGLAPGKSSFSITREAQVNIRMDSFDEDLARPSGILAQERKLCRDLVHSNKKEQEFRSIFHHIQSAQSQRSPSELFAQHIVTIVHHVREHHFGSSAMTLNERFTKYLKKGMEQDAAKNKKSPEIHRRIDISPSTFRKHGFSQEESKSSRDPGFKAEGKYKDDPVDLRLDIERRKKHKERDLKRDKSRESVDSRDSSHSRERSTEKTEKSHKGSKKKKHRRVRERSRSSSSSSWSSHSVKGEEYPEETEEREESSTGFDKSRLGTKEFTGPNERGRARGTFQFRARGRGWGRGNFSGNNNSNSGGNNDFQKRSREEEWDPEYTPKSKKYYLVRTCGFHQVEAADKWVSRGRGRGAFPRGRGRFMFRKSSTSPKWAHDKFSGEEGEIEDDESGTENREEKDNLQTAAE